VAEESISGLDVGLTSVDVWLLLAVSWRTSSYWSSSVFVVERLERRDEWESVGFIFEFDG
jgi:hypothetical protein